MTISSSDTAPAETLIAEPKTPRVIGRPFLPGQTGNPAGRPRKGQTLADRLAKADAKVARNAIKARDKRLGLQNMVGEQAWKTYLAYNLGVPAQKFVVEQQNSPMAELMRELAGLGVLPPPPALLPPPADAIDIERARE